MNIREGALLRVPIDCVVYLFPNLTGWFQGDWLCLWVFKTCFWVLVFPPQSLRFAMFMVSLKISSV